jgi:hypothetical protein
MHPLICWLVDLASNNMLGGGVLFLPKDPLSRLLALYTHRPIHNNRPVPAIPAICHAVHQPV